MRPGRTLCLLLVSILLPTMAGAVACQGSQQDAALLKSVVTLTNAVRQKAGLPALRPDSALARSALIHACDMQRTGNFGHVGSNGSSHADRARVAGCRWQGKGPLAENIGWGYRTAEQAVAGWMGSPEHRSNMLNRRVKSVGVAHVPSDKGGYWVIELAGGC